MEYNNHVLEELSMYKQFGGDKNAAKFIHTLCDEGLFNESSDIIFTVKGLLDDLLLHKPLTPISLNEAEFIKSKRILTPGVKHHNRTDNIILIEGNTEFDGIKHHKGIINAAAYGYTVRHVYNHIDNKEICNIFHNCDYIYPFDLSYDSTTNTGSTSTQKLFITKGGIVTGDYIDFCYIKDTKSLYNIPKPINIPVSIIRDNSVPLMYYETVCVDCREPKLKELMEEYDCPISYANIKYNIRKYIKLK